MNRELRGRRDGAAARHDAALGRFPAREGPAFADELRAVIAELNAVASAADQALSDPVEVSKTYRWLGDAYFDLARGKDDQLLTRGVQAYRRAEELLTDADAPVEKAKLDFNYGNTLRGLSGGFDVGLLEAAQTRYESAARTFRSRHLPDLATSVDQQLHTIDPQLRLARMRSGMERGHDRLEELQRRLQTAGAAERERIARELQDLKKLRGQGDPQEALSEALDGIREQHESHPERLGNDDEKLRSLMQQINELGNLLKNDQTRDSETTPRQRHGDGSDQGIAHAMLERLRTDTAEGKVSSDRAAGLGEIFEQFIDTMSGPDDSVESMAARSHKMRALTRQMMDLAATPSWTTPDPEPGSRAFRAIAILEPLKRHLLSEKGRGMLPTEEASAGTDLLTRLVKLEARIRELAHESRDLTDAEGETWRLAIAVHEHARRYHGMLAQPIFATAATHAEPRSAFLSGGDELLEAARRLEQRDGLRLFEAAYRGDLARKRWNELCSATIAVFDIGVPPGAPRAKVCYELGLALVLGKPSVVAARPRQKVPFNVNLKPIRLAGDAATDADTLTAAVDQALGSIVWGGGEAGLGNGPRDTLVWLELRFGRRLSQGSVKIAMDLARGSTEDAVAFRRSLDDLLGMLGADAPSALRPAWPPSYPDSSSAPHLFHVMPFRPKWAKPTRDLAEAMCEANGWTYTRGDEAREQRIIRGIWTEIARSSAVLIDMTGLNPNVALEQGIVHALGRPCRIVAQGKPERHTFENLEKFQIHGYGRGPTYRGFEDVVRDLLESARGAEF